MSGLARRQALAQTSPLPPLREEARRMPQYFRLVVGDASADMNRYIESASIHRSPDRWDMTLTLKQGVAFPIRDGYAGGCVFYLGDAVCVGRMERHGTRIEAGGGSIETLLRRLG